MLNHDTRGTHRRVGVTMEGYVIERQWLTDAGLDAVCLKIDCTGHRCGYVGIPAGTTLDEVDYDDERVCDMDVHGGLTFSKGRGEYPVPSNNWWFGFDCAHYGDRTKCSTDPNDIERTKEFVVSECERLARQLSNRMVELASSGKKR